MDRVGEVDVVLGVDVRHRAASDDVGNRVLEQLAPDDQHARGARPADELVRREEGRVLVRAGMLGATRVELDVDVRRRCGEIPEGERAVAMEQVGDRRACR